MHLVKCGNCIGIGKAIVKGYKVHWCSEVPEALRLLEKMHQSPLKYELLPFGIRKMYSVTSHCWSTYVFQSAVDRQVKTYRLTASCNLLNSTLASHKRCALYTVVGHLRNYSSHLKVS